MSGKIRQSDVENLKAQANIADVISDYVALKPASVGSLKGLCPFHDEKTPSFNVRNGQGYYHCFGCGAGGDVYKFLQEIESLSFAESVERVASKVGYTLNYDDVDTGEVQARARTFEANQLASAYFIQQLSQPEAKKGRETLISRGFDAESMASFGVGYAPKGWSNLTEHLKSKGFTEEELVVAGLVSRGERGVYDRFRGRLVWPIRDANNQVLGFGARHLYEDDQGPKYLNTSETPVYHKSRVLYGLDLAKKAIAKKRQVVVVEGYTDVMACHLAGVDTAVATCGTAFGEEHIKVLNRLLIGSGDAPAEVIFTFDPDAAGTKAALKVYGDSGKFNALTFVATGPDGLDPSDLRQQRGDEAVVEMLQRKIPLFEFVIRHRISQFDLVQLESRIAAARAAAPVVGEITDPALRMGYIRKLADWVSLEVSEIEPMVNQQAKAGKKESVQSISLDKPAESNTEDIDRMERAIAEVLVQVPDAYTEEQLARMTSAGFGSSQIQQIAVVLNDLIGKKDAPDWLNLVGNAVRDEDQQLFRQLAVAPMPAKDEASLKKYAEGVIRKAMMNALDREKSDLLMALRRFDPESHQREMGLIQRHLQDLEKERRELQT
ncbi:MAG: DNA primase [Microbacteriaceae bacterium]|nr:DNA primase [Microbacteriaceae bacterium]